MNGLIKTNSVNLIKSSIKSTGNQIIISRTLLNAENNNNNNNNNKYYATFLNSSNVQHNLIVDQKDNNKQTIQQPPTPTTPTPTTQKIQYIENEPKELYNKFEQKQSGRKSNRGTLYLKSNRITQSEVYQTCTRRLIDNTTGEINFLKFKELIEKTSNEEFSKHLFGWCSKVMKTKEVPILEAFLFHFRRSKSVEFLKVLEYINQNDIPQNIFIFNITLFYYSEMNMIEEAKRLVDLLLSMGSSLPEKAYLAIVKTFESDIKILKLVEEKMKQDKELGIPTQLLNELIIAYVQNHRNLDSALPLLEKLEESGKAVYQNTVITLLSFFYNNGMPDRSIELLKNVSDRSPEWFSGQGFSEKVAPLCYLLLTRLPELIAYMEGNNSISKVFFNNLIQICSHKINKSGVIMVYNMMIKHYVPDSHTLKDLVYLAVRDNNLQECLYWYKTLGDLNYTLNSKVASYLIKFFIRCKHYQYIDEIIERTRKDPSLCTPMTVGSIVYYCGMISRVGLGGIDVTQNNKHEEIYKEFCNLIKTQDISFREQSTDFIIQHCLMDDKYEDAERWFYLKEKQFNIAPTKNTFSNFLSYHMVRSEFKEFTIWKKKMSQLIFSTEPTNKAIYEYFDRFYPNKIRSPSEYSKFLKQTKLSDQMANIIDMDDKNYSIVMENQSNINDFLKLIKRDKNYDGAFKIFYKAIDNNDKVPVSRDFYSTALDVALKQKSRANDVEQIFKIFIKNQSFLPPLDQLVRIFDNIYRMNKTQHYQNFINSLEGSVFPEHIKIANIVILSKYSTKKAIQLLTQQQIISESGIVAVGNNTISNSENINNNSYLTNHDFVRNAFLHCLISNGDFTRATRLIKSLLDKVPIGWIDIDYLMLYLDKIVEHEYRSDLVILILNYLQSNFVQFAQGPVHFALISNLLLEGKTLEAYNKLQETFEILKSENQDKNQPWLTLNQINLAIRVYAKHFPIPPDHNYQHWLSLKSLAEANKIYPKSVFSQLFKSLTEAGRTDLLKGIIRQAKQFSFNHLPHEAIYYMLNAYSDNPHKVLVFTNTIMKHQTGFNAKTLELIRTAFYSESKSARLQFHNIKELLDQTKSNYLCENRGKIIFTDDEIDFIDRHIVKFILSPGIKYGFEKLDSHNTIKNINNNN